MNKIIFIPILFLFFSHAKSQDSVKLFYISKFITSAKDSIQLAQCKDIEYRGATIKLLFLKNGIRTDSLFTSATAYTKFKDSVILEVLISQNVYEESDSIVITPFHKFSCKGGRGGPSSEGERKGIKKIRLKFISNPDKANVYLVPKIIWERDARLRAKDGNALKQYRIANGVTPFWLPVQEYVYIVLFKYNEKYIDVECSPTHKNPVDSVYADFKRR